MKDLFSLFSSLARKHLPSRSQHVQFFLTKLETVSRNVHINVIVLFLKKKTQNRVVDVHSHVVCLFHNIT